MSDVSSYLIRLEVEGESAAEAVEAALDGGYLQDAIVDCTASEDELEVKSALLIYGPRALTLDDVEVILTPEEEEDPPEGHFAMSDEPEKDREMEADIRARMEEGNPWAWFSAKVEVRWNGLSATNYLGCCSYDSEEDFRENSGYYGDMVQETLDELNGKLRALFAQIEPLLR